MNVISRVGTGAIFLASALALAPRPAPAAPNPIVIQQCFVTEPKPMSKLAGGTQIDYVNNSPKTANAVTFSVGYRNSSAHYVRKVTDDGSFAPGAEIVHHFKLYNDVIYGGKQTVGCTAIAVKYSDGSRWPK